VTVLVTGGSGFVGSYVVRDLLRAGHRVLVYDATTRGNAVQSLLREEPQDGALTMAQGAITDGWLLLRLCQQFAVDRIVHLASPLTQDVARNPPLGIRDVCEGTATIFEVARSCRVRRIVWASSVAVFGQASAYPGGPIANDAAHRPLSLYGSCKSLCETMATLYRTADGIDSIGLRLTVVYGAGRLRGYMSFPSHIVRDVVLGRPVTIPFGDQALNWQYVEDVSAMVLTVLDSAAPSSTSIFNTSGDLRTFREAADVLHRLAPTARIHVNPGVDDGLLDIPMDFDDTVFRQQYEYTPAFSLERGLHATFEEYQHLVSYSQTNPTAALETSL